MKSDVQMIRTAFVWCLYFGWTHSFDQERIIAGAQKHQHCKSPIFEAPSYKTQQISRLNRIWRGGVLVIPLAPPIPRPRPVINQGSWPQKQVVNMQTWSRCINNFVRNALLLRHQRKDKQHICVHGFAMSVAINQNDLIWFHRGIQTQLCASYWWGPHMRKLTIADMCLNTAFTRHSTCANLCHCSLVTNENDVTG